VGRRGSLLGEKVCKADVFGNSSSFLLQRAVDVEGFLRRLMEAACGFVRGFLCTGSEARQAVCFAIALQHAMHTHDHATLHP